MRRALGVALLALVTATPASALDVSSFRWERALETGDGLSAFEPDGPMYEHAAPGFADLRVLDARGRQVPWRPRSVRGDEQLQAPQVLNAGRQGGAAVALLDFGPERVVRDRIQLDVPLEPFVGRAEVYGSDDRRTFTRLSSTAIYDVRGATRAVSTAVVFPPSDFRYYRIRATGVKGIQGATARGGGCGRRSGRACRRDRRSPGGPADGDRGRREVPGSHGQRAPLHVVDARLRPSSRGHGLDGREGLLRRRRRPPVPLWRGGRDHAPARQSVSVPENQDLERRRRAAAGPAGHAAGVSRLHPARSGFLAALPRALRRPACPTGVRLRAAARGEGTAGGRGARPRAPERGLRATRRHPVVRGAASRADQARARARGRCARCRGLLRLAPP